MTQDTPESVGDVARRIASWRRDELHGDASRLLDAYAALLEGLSGLTANVDGLNARLAAALVEFDTARPAALLASSPAVGSAGPFWLIERPHWIGGRPHWWHPSKGWVPDVTDAIQFSRQQDAEDIRKATCTDNEVVTEHRWIAPRVIPGLADAFRHLAEEPGAPMVVEPGPYQPYTPPQAAAALLADITNYTEEASRLRWLAAWNAMLGEVANQDHEDAGNAAWAGMKAALGSIAALARLSPEAPDGEAR